VLCPNEDRAASLSEIKALRALYLYISYISALLRLSASRFCNHAVSIQHQDNAAQIAVLCSIASIPTSRPKGCRLPVFYTGDARFSQNGLGLGFCIASEIPRAHKGELIVISALGEMRFTFSYVHIRMICVLRPDPASPCGFQILSY